MTHQEAYDTICEGLAKQKRRSADFNGYCKYRGPNGLKCAVGVLIPDDKYSVSMEGSDGSPLEEVMILAEIPLCLKTLLSRCQNAHDNSDTSYGLRRRLRDAAVKFGVTPGAEKAITEWTT